MLQYYTHCCIFHLNECNFERFLIYSKYGPVDLAFSLPFSSVCLEQTVRVANIYQTDVWTIVRHVTCAIGLQLKQLQDNFHLNLGVD